MRSFNFETVKHLTVYHGGREGVEDTPRCPFFVSPEIKMAASYASDRGADNGHHGILTQFAFTPRKIAHQEDIERVVLEMGIADEDEIHQTSVFEFISPAVHDEAHTIIARLQQAGFDSACFNDFGMDCPFTEYEAYCVFDPTVLSFEAVIPVTN